MSCKPPPVSDGPYSPLNEVTGLVRGSLLPPAKEVDISDTPCRSLTHPGHGHTGYLELPSLPCHHQDRHMADT